MMSTPAPSSAAGTASQTQLRPRARAWRAGAATVAACAAQSTAYDGTRESVSLSAESSGPGGPAPRAGSGCPRASTYFDHESCSAAMSSGMNRGEALTLRDDRARNVALLDLVLDPGEGQRELVLARS